MNMKKYAIFFLLSFAFVSFASAEDFTRDLFVGIRNDPEVVRLQEFLRAKGFFTYPESTGNYFSLTQQAVAAFQLAHNITPPAGYFGPLTRNAVNGQLSGEIPITLPPENTPTPPFTEFKRTFSPGLTNDPDVVRLQEFLRTMGYFTYPVSNGNYFSLTEEAVRKYQEANDLRVHGRFDANTLREVNKDITDGVIIVDNTTTRTLPPSETATSTFHEIIIISQFRGNRTDPVSEQVTISNKSKEQSVNITGWTITNARGGRITIPQVQNLPGGTSIQLSDLILTPRGTVIITVGKQDRNINFRENLCTGYFKETSKFTPSIGSRCPNTIDTADLTYFSDRCLEVIDDIRGCRTPDSGDFFGIESECSDYLIENFSYAGCVRNYKNQENFYQNRWLIWLQKDAEMFRNTHETITLRDTNGKFVDERGY
ncbi:MAG: hypothetical protein COU90_02770 [Candidatus Ryanbacteria bacterium CG10_big_fil_rev_8_21_14_0_10_43_42]|uniref:LTD domain-containing protein n=1 Tax=Candidatus Ryanbacteria bacterium CG10_big_fil_rev_8_21_14_0_10_43_42 TaxID=1974864 RepID=A0A2M8KWQ2_9BACT|nr:MAG: hypothetical protein COU90_02770 [Candidatus Ryanbacteria bacterium CG10_big_fil_rev_8_21_14_0_10_43_42]